MLEEAVEIMTPSFIGSIIGFTFVVLLFGLPIAILLIRPLVIGNCGGFIAALYFILKANNKDN